jgi:DNA-binding NarL/FixJ family response regulator
MNLTERERRILQLAKQGLSDYRIARKMSMDPPNVTRSRKNAHRKLMEASIDIEWALKIGVTLTNFSRHADPFRFFL